MLNTLSPYPKQSELLDEGLHSDWLDRHFLRSDPFAFKRTSFREFALRSSSQLNIDPNGIFCVGSGAVGLSLNPDKIDAQLLRRFDDASDLDIALISEVHFERAWRNLRELAYPAVVGEMEQTLVKAMGHQRSRFFDGAILANKLLPYLDFGQEWVSALTNIQESAAIHLSREVEVNCWIYRDYWSVRNYVAKGVLRCKEKLQ